MKYLIIGLGNPGTEYENTRHNIGFRVLDKLASLSNISFLNDRHADICEILFRGRKIILAKPTTFMNLSGKAVQYWMQKTKVKQENLLVITDDISLPFGVLRLRKKGSNGGHNGLKDIEEYLGNSNYSRIRIGISNDKNISMTDYVLGKWTKEEQLKIPLLTNKSIEIIFSFLQTGLERTMNFYNKKNFIDENL